MRDPPTIITPYLSVQNTIVHIPPGEVLQDHPERQITYSPHSISSNSHSTPSSNPTYLITSFVLLGEKGGWVQELPSIRPNANSMEHKVRIKTAYGVKHSRIQGQRLVRRGGIMES
jgi:hypothetical protein